MIGSRTKRVKRLAKEYNVQGVHSVIVSKQTALENEMKSFKKIIQRQIAIKSLAKGVYYIQKIV